MQNAAQKKVNDEIKNSPIAWFYVLEDARREGDFERAAQAQRELRRLGIEIRYKGISAGA